MDSSGRLPEPEGLAEDETHACVRQCQLLEKDCWCSAGFPGSAPGVEHLVLPTSSWGGPFSHDREVWWCLLAFTHVSEHRLAAVESQANAIVSAWPSYSYGCREVHGAPGVSHYCVSVLVGLDTGLGLGVLAESIVAECGGKQRVLVEVGPGPLRPDEGSTDLLAEWVRRKVSFVRQAGEVSSSVGSGAFGFPRIDLFLRKQRGEVVYMNCNAVPDVRASCPSSFGPSGETPQTLAKGQGSAQRFGASGPREQEGFASMMRSFVSEGP